jgi:Gnt-I system high-affinity gluconate transporter
VILVPLIFTLVKKTGLPLLYIAIPTAASLSTTHCFLPPHPGPTYLVNAMKADMGKVLLYGMLIAIPAVIIAGPLLGRQLKKIKTDISGSFLADEEPHQKKLPATLPSFIIALLPVLLITLSVVASYFLPDGLFKTVLLFIGNATVALLITVLLALYYFGIRSGVSMPTAMKWLNDAISGIALILLIITAGGVFSQVLRDSGTANYISSFSSQLNMPPLIFAWLVTALLRVSIGAATVAGITAAGIVAPLVTPGVSPELMVLAVGAGSVFGSHINDSGFWMFKEFFKLSLKQTFLSWTVMETLISIIGLIGVLILNLFI